MKVLSIDLGASSGRCMVVHYENNQIRYEEINRFKNFMYEDGGYLRWDMENLISSIKIGIRHAFEKYRDIKSIGIDSWGVDYCYINKVGKLIENPICYRDRRTNNVVNECLRKIPFKSIYQSTGIQFLNFNSIFQLYHDFEYRKNVMAKVDKLLMISDYIAYVLTGEKRLEVTNASTMSLLNHINFDFDESILQTFNINKSIFPRFIKPGEAYGKIRTTLIPVNVDPVNVIATCSHDTASAILGTSINKNSMYISSGTWSLLGLEIEKPEISPETLNSGFTNELGYNYSIDFLKNVTGMFICNQLLAEWEIYGQKILPGEIDRIISDVPKYEGYIDVDDETLFTPGNMQLKLKKYLTSTNQYYPVFKGQWLDTIYMSMAAKYKYHIDKLKKIYPYPINEIIICGGGNQANTLNQYIANLTQMKVIQGPIEATVLGNALVQLIANHAIKDEVEGRQIIQGTYVGKTYLPQESEKFSKEYQTFLKITKLGEHKNG